MSGERLARVIRDKLGGSVYFVKACEEFPNAVVERLRPGDVVLTLGAGSIGQIGLRIMDKLEPREMAVAL